MERHLGTSMLRTLLLRSCRFARVAPELRRTLCAAAPITATTNISMDGQGSSSLLSPALQSLRSRQRKELQSLERLLVRLDAEATDLAVLRDSLTADASSTVMITHVGPANRACELSLNSLRYAERLRAVNGGGGGTWMCRLSLMGATNG